MKFSAEDQWVSDPISGVVPALLVAMMEKEPIESQPYSAKTGFIAGKYSPKTCISLPLVTLPKANSRLMLDFSVNCKVTSTFLFCLFKKLNYGIFISGMQYFRNAIFPE